MAAYHYSFTLNYPTVKNHLYCCGRGLAARSLAELWPLVSERGRVRLSPQSAKKR